jgi:hypothetical protein
MLWPLYLQGKHSSVSIGYNAVSKAVQDMVVKRKSFTLLETAPITQPTAKKLLMELIQRK